MRSETSALGVQNTLIKLILKINKKFFFKREHPFNTSKNWVLNLNYSDFEYNHTEKLLNTYSSILDVNILKNKKILEVWCGWWWKSVFIAEKYNSEVIAIDIDDIFLAQAKDFAKQKKVDKRIDFYKKSALDTGFEDGQFDIIIMSDVIEHIPETQKLFEEVWRILKKDWVILFDFAPYYHYFGHHLWDTIQIPWLHLFFTDKFLIKLYKKSVEDLIDGKQRIDLRISMRPVSKETGLIEIEYFWYLNKISRKDFEKIVWVFLKQHNIKQSKINYYMLRNMNFLARIPFLREVFIRHIVWYIKK